MDLEAFTPLQRRVFTLDLIEQVEYALSIKGDFKRSFALEELEGLHPFSGREKYLKALEGDDDSIIVALRKLLSEEDQWAKNVIRLLRILRSEMPESVKNLNTRLKDAASLH